MRLRHPGGDLVHLAYCSNVHPAETLDGLVDQLDRFAAPLRAALDVERVGVGLWIPAAVLDEVEAPGGVARLRTAIARAGAEVVTFNGFPYGGFHAPVVKYAVYRPDWADPQRLHYTLRLARLLAELLPDDVADGSISTLPLGWRHGWDQRAGGARAALDRLVDGLAGVERATGRSIRVGFEPEPGCTVETTAQAVDALAGVDTDRLGVCLDACHTAVQFEDPAEAVRRLRAAGLPIVKAQLSSALRATDPRRAAERARLEAFVEPRFLHQTRERADGAVTGVDDLDEALAGGLAGVGEWRVHFHVPVHAGSPGTTQSELTAMIDALLAGDCHTRHLEVETYTWGVLPPDQRPADEAGLVAGLARELHWVREHLAAIGLTAVSERGYTAWNQKETT